MEKAQSVQRAIPIAGEIEAPVMRSCPLSSISSFGTYEKNVEALYTTKSKFATASFHPLSLRVQLTEFYIPLESIFFNCF